MNVEIISTIETGANKRQQLRLDVRAGDVTKGITLGQAALAAMSDDEALYSVGCGLLILSMSCTRHKEMHRIADGIAATPAQPNDLPTTGVMPANPTEGTTPCPK